MKRIASVFLMAIFCNPAYGQTDIELLSRAKNYINTKYVALILNHASNKVNRDEAKDITSILDKNNLSNPFTYEELETLVKDRFDTSVVQYILKVDLINITELTILSTQDAIERLNDEAYFISRETFGNLISTQLKRSVYEQILSELDTKSNEENNTALIDREDLMKTPENIPFIQDRELWLGILVMINTAVLGYAFLRMVRIKSKLIEAKQTIANLKEIKKDEKSKFLPVYYEFRTLVTDKLKEYEDNLVKLKNKLQQQDPTWNEDLTSGIETATTITKSGQVLYMRAPFGNFFPLSALTTKEKAFYQLVMEDDMQKASFEIINDGAPLLEAIAQPSIYLEPACFATNKPGGNTRKIITSIPGMVSYSDNVWVVTQKAIIVFT